MAVVHNKHPIEQSFYQWINNYPESFHPIDMERFYIFVKCVCRYGRKMKGYKWLKDKIEKSGKKLSNDTIDTYCNKFVTLQEFYKASCIQIYEC